MDAVEIHAHPEPIDTIIPWLQDQLPFSGPLLRRIQSSHFFFSPPIGYCLATFPPDRAGPPKDQPWMVGWVNMPAWPETQVWVYSSLEPDSSISPSSSLSEFNADAQSIEIARAQFHSLVSHIRHQFVPPYLSSLEPGAPKPETDKVTKAGVRKHNVHAPSALLIGSAHSGLCALLKDSPPTSPLIHVIRGVESPCAKYVFRSPSFKARGAREHAALPPGYRFHDRAGREGVKFEHLDLVLDRTNIQRTKAGLDRMGSVALYFDPPREGEPTRAKSIENGEAEDSPIGWVFLAYDGSIVVLHVEPEHRGRRLAVALAKEIIRRAMDKGAQFPLDLGGHTNEKEEGWVYADVELTNTASHRVMDKLDGEIKWTLSWVVAEVCVPGECDHCARNS